MAHSIQDVQSVLQKYDFSKIEVVHLDRANGKDNRSKAKAFAVQVDRALSGFQDSDVVLIVLTVRHKP